MKISKCWLANAVLHFACVCAPVATWPQEVAAQTTAAGLRDSGCPSYGHDAGGTRYSPATQMNRDNVAQLKVAWAYRTGALDQIADDLKEHAAFEATPILVDGRLYLSTPLDHVIALEPASCLIILVGDSKLDDTREVSEA